MDGTTTASAPQNIKTDILRYVYHLASFSNVSLRNQTQIQGTGGED
jgi:hypothetical protein